MARFVWGFRQDVGESPGPSACVLRDMTHRSKILTDFLVVLALGLSACGAGVSGDTPPSASSSPPSTILPPATDPAVPDQCLTASQTVVHFTTSDGVTLAAAILGSGSRGVLLAHMGGAGQNL